MPKNPVALLVIGLGGMALLLYHLLAPGEGQSGTLVTLEVVLLVCLGFGMIGVLIQLGRRR